MELEEFAKIKIIVEAVSDLKLSPTVEINDYADTCSVKFNFKRPTKK